MPDKDIPLVKKLLNEFNKRNISYCHFKSNFRVSDGISGKTDLDLLVSRSQHEFVARILLDNNAKLFRSLGRTSYPAVDDWLLHDPESGKMAHVHLHWQMVLGEKHLKGYHFPIEARILETRIFDTENGIFTASPEAELLLLLVRSCLKLRFFSLFKWIFMRSSTHKDSIKKEFAYLVNCIELPEFEAMSRCIFSEGIAKKMVGIVSDASITGSNYIILRSMVISAMRDWRTYSPLIAFFKRWWRVVNMYTDIIFGLDLSGVPKRRIPSTGGLLVAIVGVDGSGKSTSLLALEDWLRWKLDVTTVYLGSGDGEKSSHRKAILMFANFLATVGVNQRGDNVSESRDTFAGSRRVKAFLLGLFRITYAISLAIEKRAKIKKVVRARNRGMIVLSDRYPQLREHGYNDGPLIENKDHNLFRFFSRIELRLLSIFSRVKPDVLIKLVINQDIAKSRKQETPIADIVRKIKFIKKLEYGEGCKSFEIDASIPQEQVVLKIKNILWDLM